MEGWRCIGCGGIHYTDSCDALTASTPTWAEIVEAHRIELIDQERLQQAAAEAYWRLEAP